MVQGNTVKLDIDITESDSWDKFLEVMNNTSGTFDDFIQMVKLHGTFDATNPALVQATMDRVDTYVQELEQKWGIKMEDVNLHVKQGQYVFEQGGRTHRPPDPTPDEEETKDAPKFMDIISEGVTKMMPGGGLVEAFKSMGAIPAIAVGVVGILGFVKKMFEHSQILNTYSNAFMKIFGHFTDLIMIAFLPILNTVLIWLITKVRPVVASFAEWLGNNQAIAAVLGAVILGAVVWKALPGLITTGVMVGMRWLLTQIGAAIVGDVGGRFFGGTGARGRGLRNLGIFAAGMAAVGALGYTAWQAFDDDREGFGDFWGENTDEDTEPTEVNEEEIINRVLEDYRQSLNEGGGEEDEDAQKGFEQMLSEINKIAIDQIGKWLEPDSVAIASERPQEIVYEDDFLGYTGGGGEEETFGNAPPRASDVPRIAEIENFNNAFRGGDNNIADATNITQDGTDVTVQQYFNTSVFVAGEGIDDSVVQYLVENQGNDNVIRGVTRGGIGGG